MRLWCSRPKSPARVRRQMHRRVLARQLRAITGGYFWLPCPRCGTHSGGHEWAGRFTITTDIRLDDNGHEIGHSAQGVCPACEAELAQIGAALCQQAGQHDWVLSYPGMPGHTSTSGSRHEVTFKFSDKPEVWCRHCGIDAGYITYRAVVPV